MPNGSHFPRRDVVGISFARILVLSCCLRILETQLSHRSRYPCETKAFGLTGITGISARHADISPSCNRAFQGHPRQAKPNVAVRGNVRSLRALTCGQLGVPLRDRARWIAADAVLEGRFARDDCEKM